MTKRTNAGGELNEFHPPGEDESLEDYLRRHGCHTDDRSPRRGTLEEQPSVDRTEDFAGLAGLTIMCSPPTTTSPLEYPEDPPSTARNPWPSPPAEGATYTDDEGARWDVTSVSSTDSFPGFYLVHVRVTTAGGAEGAEVLGPREFAALVRGRGLRRAV
jgi:hypothetical protein